MKHFLIYASVLAGFALSAEGSGLAEDAAPDLRKETVNVFKNWGYSRSDIAKMPGARTDRGSAATLKYVHDDQIFYRPADPLDVTLHDKVEITFTASGKGCVKIGFFAYVKDWSYCGTKTVDFHAAPEKTTVTEVFTVPVTAKLIRPVILSMPDSEVTFYEYSIRVLPFANPQLEASAVLSRPDALYQAGEKAVYTIDVKCGGKPAKEGHAVLHIRHDTIEKQTLDFDLSRENPIRLEVSLDRPGFADVLCDLKGIPGFQDRTDIQMGGAGFSPEKIRTGAPAPDDLLTYWQGEYQKLCREVPPDFQLKKVKEDGRFTDYQLTARNFGGTRTYATLTIPKGEGPFPMFFSVPPAGMTVYGFYRRAGAITLCTSVHDTDQYDSQASYQADMKKNGWYFYRNEGTRKSFYYYKSILGVMRMMDYAMHNIKEWDGRHLAAGGQSQGGGFTFIMAALNPKIQAIFADIPALCDHNAAKAGRGAGWPQLLEDPVGKKLSPEDASYFDAACFASFVKCPAVVAVGFIDTMCLPSSVYAAFNNLKGPKQIINCVHYGHGWGTRDPDFSEASRKLIDETLHAK